MSLQELSRDELEERVRDLEETQEQLSQQIEELQSKVEKNEHKPGRVAFNTLLDAIVGADIQDYQASPLDHQQAAVDFGEQVRTLNSRLTKVEEIAEEEETLSDDPSVSNWQAIVEDAKSLHGHPQHSAPGDRVKVYKKQVATAVDCSERYALQLIEQFGEEKRGAEWQEYKRHNTSRDTPSNDIQKKALVIDMEVWG